MKPEALRDVPMMGAGCGESMSAPRPIPAAAKHRRAPYRSARREQVKGEVLHLPLSVDAEVRRAMASHPKLLPKYNY